MLIDTLHLPVARHVLCSLYCNCLLRKIEYNPSDGDHRHYWTDVVKSTCCLGYPIYVHPQPFPNTMKQPRQLRNNNAVSINKPTKNWRNQQRASANLLACSGTNHRRVSRYAEDSKDLNPGRKEKVRSSRLMQVLQRKKTQQVQQRGAESWWWEGLVVTLQVRVHF